MSVAGAIIGFFIGSGLLVLGAFFLRRWVGIATLLPVGTVVLVATVCGQTEIAVGLLWGTVAINLVSMAVLTLSGRVRLARGDYFPLVWLILGAVAVLVAGRRGELGMFSGWALLVVGLVALWSRYKQSATKPVAGATLSGVWQWVTVVVAVLVVLSLGTWLVVSRYTVVSTVCGLPVSVFAVVVLAPLLSVGTWSGLRNQGQWQAERLWRGWLWANVVLVTIAMGLVAVWSGGVHLTPSTVLVTLPWVTGLAVMSAVTLWLPKKTARWWGGLVLVMYVAYLVTLLW